MKQSHIIKRHFEGTADIAERKAALDEMRREMGFVSVAVLENDGTDLRIRWQWESMESVRLELTWTAPDESAARIRSLVVQRIMAWKSECFAESSALEAMSDELSQRIGWE